MNSAIKEQRECTNDDVIWSGLVEVAKEVELNTSHQVKTSDADADELIIDGGN